jgi:NAD(P)-dependent dehydrogenase (short-subunit alcohol dehydrogenase family)
MGRFSEHVVIVTGGAKGIGQGISLAFAEAGACVVCADVDDAAGEEVAASGEAMEGSIDFRSGDVSKDAVCSDLVGYATEEYGGVHVLCNNVGIQPTSSYLPAHEMTEEMWDRIIDVNLKSTFLMSRHAIPVMQRQRRGVIINTASVQGLQSAKGVSAYAASKGGQLSLTRQLALEYAGDNIRVLAVNPGTIDTPLVDEALEALGANTPEAREGMAAVHPIGRIGQPADIAKVVLFLASDDASFMTGESVCVDGGVMAKGAWA